MIAVTVFTPTYNRASLLVKAYNSLKAQTCFDFEWLIIDDGSTDNTKDIVDDFIGEKVINIRYYYQENRGQYYAHNTAAQLAEGELFTFLDSDDAYLERTVEKLLLYYNQIKNNPDFAGVAGLKATNCGQIVGGEVDYTVLDCSIIDFRYKYGYKGDRLEAFRTSLIKEYLFPIYDGKFVPNALIWNRISHVLKMRFFSEVVEYYEWSDTSMSRSIIKNRQSTPDAYLLYYAELSNYNIPLYYKIRSSINFWRFAFYSHVSFKRKVAQIGVGKSILGLPLGIICCIVDRVR